MPFHGSKVIGVDLGGDNVASVPQQNEFEPAAPGANVNQCLRL
jgi:hypothetical protein